MKNLNDGGPAFPEPGLAGLPNGEFIHGRAGMPLRDYFAAKAMQGFCARYDDFTQLRQIAEEAYVLADAMIAARTPA